MYYEVLPVSRIIIKPRRPTAPVVIRIQIPTQENKMGKGVALSVVVNKAGPFTTGNVNCIMGIIMKNMVL